MLLGSSQLCKTELNKLYGVSGLKHFSVHQICGKGLPCSAGKQTVSVHALPGRSLMNGRKIRKGLQQILGLDGMLERRWLMTRSRNLKEVIQEEGAAGFSVD
jgi:hypothetical protein